MFRIQALTVLSHALCSKFLKFSKLNLIDDLQTFDVQCEEDLFLPTFPGIKLLEDRLANFNYVLTKLQYLEDLVLQQINSDEVRITVCYML